MKEYDVKITETLEKTVTVQAESHDAAEEQVRAAYYNSEYILDSENFTGVAFGTTEEREVQKEQADTMNVLLVKPFMYPQAVQIGCELEDLQKAVGGDSLRHSSITYKLKLNGGDMKSVQGDSGHAQVKMVADVYSHIIDDDRRLNAERMEAAFYSGRQATPEPVQPAATESSADDKELLLKLLQNPEMAALLKSLAKTL